MRWIVVLTVLAAGATIAEAQAFQGIVMDDGNRSVTFSNSMLEIGSDTLNNLRVWPKIS